MAVEVERKFLVNGRPWQAGARAVRYRQGYLSTAQARTVRVRLEGDRGVLTVKGQTHGISRLEFEYEIPAADAARMLEELCERPLIEKDRYRVTHGSHTWDIDVFHGDNAGLVVAEIELASADDAFEPPPWLGREVSDDPRYFNANLIRSPYRTWTRP